MTLLFQNPAWLGLLLLAALPLLVHLLSRARPPVYRFSNLDFLRRVMRRTARLRRPQNWLLWLLRTLALLAIAACFAGPVLVSKQAALPGEPSTVVLMIDRSASMAAREGVGSRFDTACAKAVEFLKQSAPDEANLIWIDAEPDAVYPAPGSNVSYLSDQLKQARPALEAGALEAALGLALRQLSMVHGHRELVIISDFQATAWREFDIRVPEGVVLRREQVATATPPNVSIARLIPQPSDPVASQDLTLLVGVNNFSSDPVRTEVTLDAGGSRQSQSLNLPSWGSAECAFVMRPASAGPLPISVRVVPDGFPADDARHAVVQVRDFLRLGIAPSTPAADAGVLGKFANALPWIEVEKSLGAGGPVDMTFIGSWAGSDVEQLRKDASSGMLLVIRPAPACSLAALRELAGLSAAADDGALALDSSTTGWAVLPDEKHRANSLFRSGDFGNPYAGVIRERLRLPRSLAEEEKLRPVAIYADGVPAVLECPTDGASILLWNLPLDPVKTDWPTQSNFLPAMAELLLRNRHHGNAPPAYSLPGQPIHWLTPEVEQVGTVTVLDPSSVELVVRRTAAPSGSVWQTDPIAVTGIYQWQVSSQTAAYSAVNFPQEESDLRSLAELPESAGSRNDGNSLVRQAMLSHGIPLWRWLIAMALLLLCIESLIHMKFAAKRVPQS